MAALNIRSLIKHFDDLRKDVTILQSDIIITTETNYPLGPFTARELDGYESFNVKGGKGKGNIFKIFVKAYILFYFSLWYVCFITSNLISGVSIFVKTHLSQKIQIWHTQSINEDSHQILKIKMEKFSIMGVYRSPSYASRGT